SAAFTDSGFYFVVVSNFINAVSSRFALLTVATDVTGPTLVAADGSDSPTNVTVSFSEQVSAATATNIANYRITNMTAGSLLTISKAVLSKGTNVILTTAARVDGVTYL